FSVPQTHLWLIKHLFSASTFVMKIATFAKPETVVAHAVRQFGLRRSRTTLENKTNWTPLTSYRS
ncbi:MAG: hypothetical protein ACKN9X_03095, partial [Candidatus Methylopumilus sp.]